MVSAFEFDIYSHEQDVDLVLSNEWRANIFHQQQIDCQTYSVLPRVLLFVGDDNLIKIYDSNNGQLVKVLPQEFDGVEFVGWNGTEYRVLVSMPMVYDLVSELDYLVVSDGKEDGDYV